ncbi:MAG: thioredoxin family protein [Flavobacterium sp. BFFFF1]|uniref:thioredoxin family protein n=1 Tax=Flavobacterium sp. BFFFF1 TaxID=2015557 RepID=UPI000BD17253|nr:thioredoxin family protein [Flavobacterium sp. BFFFF1]OYU82167.1 MAG: thioredoxin family protein [Flavobacterium sp. BFFFF1]
MKKSIILTVMVLFALAARSQDLKWYTDVKEASELSIKTKKPLMMFFTGSDWCGWCNKLQKEVFKTADFAKWANENVILVELDFPKRKQLEPELAKQNNDLGQMFAIRGYPTVWLVTPSKNNEQFAFERLGSIGYVYGGAQEWIKQTNVILKK